MSEVEEKEECKKDINSCAIETFDSLGESYVRAEIADISSLSPGGQKAYNRRLNDLYNEFMTKQAEVYAIAAESIENDVIKLKKEIKRFNKALDDLSEVSELLLAFSSIINIIKSITGLISFASAAPSLLSSPAKSFMISEPATAAPAIMSAEEKLEIEGSDACLQQVIDERNFLREILIKIVDNKEC